MIERFVVEIEADPQHTHISGEVAPFAEAKRVLVASPGPDPITSLVSLASSPIDGDCVGESASPPFVPEDTVQALRISTRQRRPPERLKDFIMSRQSDSYKNMSSRFEDLAGDLRTVKSQLVIFVSEDVSIFISIAN